MATRELGPIAAIVLTGGRSRRMGADKAALVVNGQTLLDRTLGVVAAAGIDHVAVAGSAELPDPTAESLGPLAGIVNGWAHLQVTNPTTTFDAVVVLSVDLPSLPEYVIRDLVSTSLHHAHGCVAHDGERPQPLIAAYTARALDEFASGFAAGERSVRSFFARWDLGKCPTPAAAIADADRPEDLAGFVVEWPAVEPPVVH